MNVYHRICVWFWINGPSQTRISVNICNKDTVHWYTSDLDNVLKPSAKSHPWYLYNYCRVLWKESSHSGWTFLAAAAILAEVEKFTTWPGQHRAVMSEGWWRRKRQVRWTGTFTYKCCLLLGEVGNLVCTFLAYSRRPLWRKSSPKQCRLLLHIPVCNVIYGWYKQHEAY